jgi:surfactin synthase thioesterase subunit
LPWQLILDPAIEVCAIQLPGRGDRLDEAPIKAFPELIPVLGRLLAEQSTMPFAFFGHSLGALIAFELARHCQLGSADMPVHFFASGCAAPQCLNPGLPLEKLQGDALMKTVDEYNGTKEGILENPELMALILPAIRADFALADTYRYNPGPRLDIPITVLAGERDDGVSVEQVEGWQRETTHTIRVVWFEGDHFFINAEQTAVLDLLEVQLANHLCSDR